VAALVLLGVAFLTRQWWLPLPARFLLVEDPLPAAGAPADALVPLAGGDERAPYAAHLLQEGYADWFVATSMPLHVPAVRATYGELVRQEAIQMGVPQEQILIVPGTVRTTWEEALAVRRLFDEQGWHSLLVVTDPLHTRRARLCFREAFQDTGVAIAVCAVEDSWYDPEAWWKSIDSLRETWTEYLKLALHLVGYR
jgi:uncharacterized SAM-binding protein YcdF (DUF218 family)